MVDDADTHITHIELAYYNHLAEPIEIKDAEVIETICAYIKQVGGERAESTKGIYGIPYILTLYSDADEPFVFYLWNEGKYSTSRDTDEDAVISFAKYIVSIEMITSNFSFGYSTSPIMPSKNSE